MLQAKVKCMAWGRSPRCHGSHSFSLWTGLSARSQAAAVLVGIRVILVGGLGEEGRIPQGLGVLHPHLPWSQTETCPE
jgi:hypothetical protein